MKRYRWDHETPLPKHPYRDTLIFYCVLALIIVVLAWATGGNVARAATFAIGFLVIATTWSWTRWRRKLRAAKRPPP